MADQKQEPRRPLPRLDEPDTGPFWAATKDKQLTYQQCTKTGKVVWYPRRHSTGSVHGELEWKTASGNGTVYSFSVVRQSYHPFFRKLAPTPSPGSTSTKARACCQTSPGSTIPARTFRSAPV